MSLSDVLNNVLSLFQINIDTYIDTKIALYKHFRLQSSEIESWPFYELEMTVKKLKEILEKQKEQEEKQTKEQQKNTPNMNNYTKSFNKYKMPSVPKFK